MIYFVGNQQGRNSSWRVNSSELMMQETFLRILLSSAVCECGTRFDGRPWCEHHRRHDLYMPAFPRLLTFPSGKLVIHTD